MKYVFKASEIEIFKSVLTQFEYELLFSNLKANGPSTSCEVSLNEAEADKLVDLISNKFMEVGLKADSEPNTLGLQIESLIDKILKHN
ncbi:MAG: hypothetical protein ABI041_16015 [Bdellovibrionia bacterium]